MERRRRRFVLLLAPSSPPCYRPPGNRAATCVALAAFLVLFFSTDLFKCAIDDVDRNFFLPLGLRHRNKFGGDLRHKRRILSWGGVLGSIEHTSVVPEKKNKSK